MTYDIVGYEYPEGTETPETFTVLKNGKDTHRVFATYAEALAWVKQQGEA